MTLLLAGVILVLTAGTAPARAADLDLTQYRGKIVYLDFWASWCVPCRRSFPWMNAMQRKYGKQGLVVLGVNEDDDPAATSAFLDKHPADFRVLRDGGGKLASRYQLMGMPSAFVIDRDGRVVAKHIGFKKDSPGRLEAQLRKLLNASSGGKS